VGNGAVAAAVILCCLRPVGAEHAAPALRVQVKIPSGIGGEEAAPRGRAAGAEGGKACQPGLVLKSRVAECKPVSG